MKTVTFDENTHKLVPLEPTDEMVEAAIACGPNATKHEYYEHMLAAVPSPVVEPALPDDMLHYNAQRLRNVAQLVGLEKAIPPDDATLDGARGAVLGMIARRISKPDVADMVNRFLGWPMPKNFSPDGGMTFKAPAHPNSWPIGTNLLNADQAKAMFEHCLATPPSDGVTSPTDEVCHNIVCDDRCSFPSCMGPESAAAPAHTGSVDGIDSPELRAAVDNYVRFFSTDESADKGVEYWQVIIANITAVVQAAKQEAESAMYEQFRRLLCSNLGREYTPDSLLLQLLVDLKAAAKQEGRLEGLEQAAKSVEGNFIGYRKEDAPLVEIAAAIRTLATQPSTKPEGGA